MNGLLCFFLLGCSFVTCYAAEYDPCVIAHDCSGACDDSTHHWACITSHFHRDPHCKCMRHPDPNAATTTTTASNPASSLTHHEGGYCASRSQCAIYNCVEDHCVDEECRCTRYSSHHHHHDDK